MFGGGQKGEWRGYGPAQKGERWESVMVVRRGNGGMCGGGEKREWWDGWGWSEGRMVGLWCCS